MSTELPVTEGVKFGLTLRNHNGSVAIVDDGRNQFELPTNVSVSRIDVADGVDIREGATGRAVVCITSVRETTGTSGHRYVQLQTTRFDEETVEAPKASTRTPRTTSRITMRGGERDVAGPRSVSYSSATGQISRRKL